MSAHKNTVKYNAFFFKVNQKIVPVEFYSPIAGPF